MKSSSPYYINDEIELSWNIQNADAVYLNGKTQYGLRKSKTIKYDSSGKKRLTLKVVKGELEVSRTINFEILPKIEETAQQESTRVILADIVEDEQPVINFFKRSGTDKIYVGDEISVYWQVKGADSITVNGAQVPKTSKKTIVKLYNVGENAITLTATNSAGTVKKCVNVTIHQRQLPSIRQFDATKKSNVSIGESVKLMWNVEDCHQVKLGRDEIVPAKGSRLVAFQHGGSYAYTLHATNQFGTESRTINIIVNGEPHPNGYSKKSNGTSYNNSQSQQIQSSGSNGLYWLFSIIISAAITYSYAFDMAQSPDPTDKFYKGLTGFFVFGTITAIILRYILKWFFGLFSSKK